MLKIKVTIAGCPSTSIKQDISLTSISKFLPEKGNTWKNSKFFVNEEISDPDYWIIIDDINGNYEVSNIHKERIFFLTAEVPFVTSYFDDQQYLSQFYKIYSAHAIYNHDNNISSLPFLPFMINAKYGESVFAYDIEFNYDKMLVRNELKKTKTLSIIASNKGSKAHNMTEFHKIRYHFAQRLKEHFKDKIDLYGYGYNEIESKADAILPYKYHICLENQSSHNVITEKLYDSFLGLAYPIYWGAPNVYDYFPNNSLTSINIIDFKQSVQTIEEVIEGDIYEKRKKNLIKAKNDVLNKYGVFQRIAEICEGDARKNGIIEEREEVKIFSRKSFVKKECRQIKKMKKILKYGVPSIMVYELAKLLLN